MLRLITFSLIAFTGLLLIIVSCGPDPKKVEERLMLAELNREEGERFRTHHATLEGVLNLPSGLQLQILHTGEGEIPDLDDLVTVHYRGFHLDGREFDSSYRRQEAATIPVTLAIPGWQEALTMIPKGSHVRLVVPYWLGYGEQGVGRAIGPAETLIFEVKLLQVHAHAD